MVRENILPKIKITWSCLIKSCQPEVQARFALFLIILWGLYIQRCRRLLVDKQRIVAAQTPTRKKLTDLPATGSPGRSRTENWQVRFQFVVPPLGLLSFAISRFSGSIYCPHESMQFRVYNLVVLTLFQLLFFIVFCKFQRSGGCVLLFLCKWRLGNFPISRDHLTEPWHHFTRCGWLATYTWLKTGTWFISRHKVTPILVKNDYQFRRWWHWSFQRLLVVNPAFWGL